MIKIDSIIILHIYYSILYCLTIIVKDINIIILINNHAEWFMDKLTMEYGSEGSFKIVYNFDCAIGD